ncbi:hypothetical protein ACJ73_01907 [Blastomyces percursus]|uniref:Uncharacterized protein n=1 Tax=Blastomyces percursus TaxID=1658174 RepID=A0A1J9R2Q7_9EURO|nr:hypothetical protein ACJ73_01907 [Blastomyces percursus]
MSPTSNNVRLLENYAGLQELRINELRSLIDKLGEYEVSEWYKLNKTQPGFECLHIALARRQGQNIYIDGKYLGLLLDWVFYGSDVTLILGKEDYVYMQKKVEEMIDWLFSVSGVEREG